MAFLEQIASRRLRLALNGLTILLAQLLAADGRYARMFRAQASSFTDAGRVGDAS